MSLKAGIQHADQDFLIALSNKGLFGRALRELPGAGVAVSWQEDALTATFADGTALTIQGAVQSYRCTCPSRVVCKHLLMAVLAAQSAGEISAGPVLLPDFSYIAATGAGALEKLAGKRVYTTAVIAAQSGQESTIEEGSTLAVRFADTGHTIRFLPSATLEGAGCSCKAANFCVHKTQAVLHVILRQNGSLDPSFSLESPEPEPAFSAAPAPIVRGFVSQTLEIGLARLPEDMSGRFLQLATICHGARLPRLERLCNRVAGQTRLLISKNAGFDRDALLGDLSDMHALCRAIEAGARDRETVGIFRERYRPQQTMTLHGLGAYQWQSTGGYTGVTLFFYHAEGAQTLRYTLALPDRSDPNSERMLDSSAPWGLVGKLRDLCRASLTLTGGKRNDYGQLSSSDDGRGYFLGGVDYLSPELAPIRCQKFSGLAPALWEVKERGQQELVVILHPADWPDGQFDKIGQVWSCVIRDEDHFPLTLQVPYQPATKTLIENLTSALPTARGRGMGLLARIWMQKGQLIAFPVTLYAQSVTELGFAQKRAKGKKKDYYDWGV